MNGDRKQHNNWRSFLQKAIQEQRTDELSDDPMTQDLLRQLREGKS